jgi:putative peptide zinc metalloprotease protein
MILFLIPLPYSTVAEGVVIVPDQAEVRAKTEGFVTQVVAAPGADVQPHQTLIALEDPILDAKVEVIEAQLDETRQRLDAVRQIDRVQAEMFEEQAAHLAERLAAVRVQERGLNVDSDQSGRFVVARAEDMPGRFVKRGDLLGYVIANGNPVIRVLAPQADVDLIRQSTTVVEAHLAEDLEHPIAARILREAPAAQQDVPSLALTTRGGGTIALDPSRTQRPQALFSFFQIDVELLEPTGARRLGSRVYVRFKHGDEPVAWRILRSLRQFFLGQFRV